MFIFLEFAPIVNIWYFT